MELLEPLEFHFFLISPSCQKKGNTGGLSGQVALLGPPIVVAEFENAASGPALCLMPGKEPRVLELFL